MRSSGDAQDATQREPSPSGEQQRRLLQQWGLQSAPAEPVRGPEPRAPRGAVVGEVLVFAIEVLVDEQSRHEIIDDLLEGYTQAVTVWAADEAGSAGEPADTQSS